MPNASEIKSRIVSIAETKKVTDAMYMISSAKMRRAKKDVANTEPYFKALKEQIAELLKYLPETKNRYFHVTLPKGREHARHGILLVTSDKGLAGSYNQTAIKMAEAYMQRHPETVLFVVGEYGRQYLKNKKVPFVSDFQYSSGSPSIFDAERICLDMLEHFDDGRVDEINIIYTAYKGAMPSECRLNVLLPLDKSAFHTDNHPTYSPFKEFYPDANTLLTEIIPSYLTGFIYSSLVDSYCSEQESRMMAMSTASKNAEEMIKSLKNEYNGIRQSAITREMIEITSGAKALQAKKKKQRKEE